jgi:hypothetical protein
MVEEGWGDAAPSLPAQRTFVVQFSATPPSHENVSRGRVEHLVTGLTTRFDTWSELQTFVARVLGRADSRSADAADRQRREQQT